MQAGGTERVISILTQKFAEQDFEVKIFIWRSIPVFYALNPKIEVIDIPARIGSDNLLKCIQWFRNYLNHKKPDLLLCFSAPFNMLSLLTSIGLHIKTVVCERNDPRFIPFKGWQRLLRNLLYGLADRILTQTTHNKEYFPRKLQKRTEVIFNPIFMSNDLVGSAKYHHEKKYIISVARLKEQKNQKMLIDVFSRFSKHYPEYELYIYGEGELRQDLEQQIRILNLSEKVFLPGTTNDIFHKIREADIFVLSSNFEGMPNTLIEAMCIGIPCISTKVSGATDLITNYENGILVDVGNDDQMLEALLKLAQDEELRRKLGHKAIHTFDLLDVEKISQEWISYIDNMIL